MTVLKKWLHKDLNANAISKIPPSTLKFREMFLQSYFQFLWILSLRCIWLNCKIPINPYLFVYLAIICFHLYLSIRLQFLSQRKFWRIARSLFNLKNWLSQKSQNIPHSNIKTKTIVNVKSAPLEHTMIKILQIHALDAHQGGPLFNQDLQGPQTVNPVRISMFLILNFRLLFLKQHVHKQPHRTWLSLISGVVVY